MHGLACSEPITRNVNRDTQNPRLGIGVLDRLIAVLPNARHSFLKHVADLSFIS
jgi:hypothetical protein